MVALQGHTDESGDEEKNLYLSDFRGDAVRAYLISQGVETTRLRVKPFGKTVPIAPNDTAEGRARNRRVELRVLQQ
jgi:OOP family OmpA-OmpF porin